MTIESLKGKKIGFLGFGVNHHALAIYLLEKGVSLTIRDRKLEVKTSFEAEHPALARLITWEITDKTLDRLTVFDIVFRSPSIPFLNPKLQSAAKKGVQIYSQTKLFFDLSPAPIIAITGTKGKGTTSSLITAVLEAGYRKGKVYLAGNIGKDPFVFLEQLTPDDLVVLELSSFQTQDLHKSPHVAVILSVGVDHLDHHKDLAEYRAAKMNLLAHQELNDITILNAEGPAADIFARAARGKVYRYTRKKPRRDSAWTHTEAGKETVFVQVGNQIDSFDSTDRILEGEHNLDNILPAVLVGALYDINILTIAKAINEFEGMAHRLFYIGEYVGADFYDDSYATNTESALAAVRSFKGRRVHLIAGGNAKEPDYSELAREILKSCVTLSLMPGTVGPILKNEIKKAKRALPHTDVQILEGAQTPLFPTILSGIHPHLITGDVVLLSPAGTSFASFTNAGERGDAFVEAVLERYDKEEHE